MESQNEEIKYVEYAIESLRKILNPRKPQKQQTINKNLSCNSKNIV